MLLGVLECDILRGSGCTNELQDEEAHEDVNVSVEGWGADVGLGEVDPERLADGGWDEVVFIGELLCWLSRRRGILPPLAGSPLQHDFHCQFHANDGNDLSEDLTSSLLHRPSSIYARADNSSVSHVTDVPRHPALHSPEASTSGTTATDLSLHIRSLSSRTSFNDFHSPEDASVLSESTVHTHLYRDDLSHDHDPPPVFHPRCIHELEEPSFMLGQAISPSDSPQRLRNLSYTTYRPRPSNHANVDHTPQNTSLSVKPPIHSSRLVRLTGWIDEVDTQVELEQFEASRAQASSGSGSRSPYGQGNGSDSLNIISPLRTLTSNMAMPVSKMGTVLVSSENDESDNDESDDLPFDVSFSASLNTSTPAKCKMKVRDQKSPTLQTSLGAGASQRCSNRPTSARLGSVVSAGRHLSCKLSSPASDDVTLHLQGRRASQSCASMHDDSSRIQAASSIFNTPSTMSLLSERARLLTELAAVRRTSNAGGSISVGRSIN